MGVQKAKSTSSHLNNLPFHGPPGIVSLLSPGATKGPGLTHLCCMGPGKGGLAAPGVSICICSTVMGASEPWEAPNEEGDRTGGAKAEDGTAAGDRAAGGKALGDMRPENMAWQWTDVPGSSVPALMAVRARSPIPLCEHRDDERGSHTHTHMLGTAKTRAKAQENRLEQTPRELQSSPRRLLVC